MDGFICFICNYGTYDACTYLVTKSAHRISCRRLYSHKVMWRWMVRVFVGPLFDTLSRLLGYIEQRYSRRSMHYLYIIYTITLSMHYLYYYIICALSLHCLLALGVILPGICACFALFLKCGRKLIFLRRLILRACALMIAGHCTGCQRL